MLGTLTARPLHPPRHVLPPRSRELAAVKLLCIERTSTATAHPWQEKQHEKQGPHFHLEARSEQRAPAADTKTGMTLSICDRAPFAGEARTTSTSRRGVSRGRRRPTPRLA
eukprot:scaffold23939_cov68-Phaeocystis_antarctica.AAC.4